MKHQHGRESAGMIFITRFMNSFLHQASFATGYWYYDRHRSVRLVILVGLAIDQIAQSGLSSLSVIYYSAQLFRGAGITGQYEMLSFLLNLPGNPLKTAPYLWLEYLRFIIGVYFIAYRI
ncbi:hypothetical protein LAD61_26815 [Klebsiella pneumoniae]|nr:hypothetical protein [Klebsiella pneumoniae]MCX9995700.1 hypothetical protein [Klebsiella pneumoniae]